ncbi:uncharacterized protein C3orf38 homolog isoform X1 [Drosophila miranda]|uniref:uncharacterized protein C3orf38 homolog isoform X1 n=2 Tax=Drosophila miranda TaxID=7229 RepID=UPI0007E6CDAC|nr:uncharacterized protein C3orf38 homolog isoform X1 [Drosophila miranda]
MPISEVYKNGLRDFLLNEKNTIVLMQLAKSTTKNVCKIKDPEEALDYLIAHVEDIHILLSKRLITRELLFMYVHRRLPGIATNFTKADLVSKVIKYWEQQQTVEPINTPKNEEEYPIHTMARKFGEWFFERFNSDCLSLVDLWNDAALHLTILASDGVSVHECETAPEVLTVLISTRNQFGFVFNPNLTHGGIQGRMDSYGQVLVLSCGTLHTTESCVGVFECVFALLRDPYSENNWKPKRLKCLLKSEVEPRILHSLRECETLQTALALPVPNEELD